MFYPWEYGEKPHFINEDGFEWYVDKDNTKHASKDDYLMGNKVRKGLKNVVAFYVRKDNEVSSLLINNQQEIVAESKTSIGLWDKIFILKVWEDYATNEDRESVEMRKKYINEVTEYTDEKVKPVKLYSNKKKYY